MAARTLISVEEYLATSYRPDCDYVDGVVVERNLGTRDHGWLQLAVAAYFFNRRRQWNITVITELRIRVKATRFRIPDVCVILGDTDEQVLTQPPFICIEVLSPKDRMKRVQERIDEYLEMGVSVRLGPRPRDQTSLYRHTRRRPVRGQDRRAQNRKPRA